MDYTQPLDHALVAKLPTPKGVALAIMEACQADVASLTDIATLVHTDPALTGQLLEHANAAALAGGRPVASVADAVARMGLKSVCQLALGFSLVEHYSSGACKAFDYKGFWSHSLSMAVAMRALGAPMRLGSGDELFAVGLLARVGCLGLATSHPQDYGALLQTGLQGQALLEKEHTTLALNHLELGAALMHRWGIPKVYIDPILLHETRLPPEAEGQSRHEQLHRALHLALRIADLIHAPEAMRGDHVAQVTELASHSGMGAQELGASIDNIVSQWRQMALRMKVTANAVASFAQIAQSATKPENLPNVPQLRVLVVEDDPITLMMVTTWLKRDEKHLVKTATDGWMAQELALDFKPHIVITDWHMPKVDGIELCKALRATEWGQKIYVFMLTAADQESELVQAFDAGVDDYLSKPVNLPALGARLKAAWRYVKLREAWEQDHERLTRMSADLALTNRRLQHAALTDPLTDLANRRAGRATLSQLWSTASRHGQTFSVISLDVDHFKMINDKYGHAAGDCVLQRIGAELRGLARKEDMVCRWGGEEFLVILPNMGLREGVLAAERLRNSIGMTSIAYEARVIHITVSLGVTEWRPDMASYEQMLAEVDSFLYDAKRGGRNRTVSPGHGQRARHST